MGTVTTGRLGSYELCERLGGGATATVHRARDRGFEGVARTVAIKRLLPHLASDLLAVRGLVREAKLGSRLDHVNIARVLDLGRAGTEHFIVMEYVEGHSLARILGSAACAPSIEAAVALLLQLCDALEHVHGACNQAGEPLGLIHCGVSPDNLLVAGTGHVKLIDFGRARLRPPELHAQGGERYLSPEAIADTTLDARADVYAAGVIARELVGARGPSALDAIVAKALASAPSQRFASAAALRDALLELCAAERIDAEHRELAGWLARAAPGSAAPRRLAATTPRAALRAAAFAPPPPAASLPASPGEEAPEMPDVEIELAPPAEAVPVEPAPRPAGVEPAPRPAAVEPAPRPAAVEPAPRPTPAPAQSPSKPQLPRVDELARPRPAAAAAQSPSQLQLPRVDELTRPRSITGTEAVVTAPTTDVIPVPHETMPIIEAARGAPGRAPRNRRRDAAIAAALTAIVVVMVAWMRRGHDAPAPQLPAVGRVVFVTEPADVDIAIANMPKRSGSPWSVELPAATHAVVISRAGYKPWSTSLELTARETQTVRVALEPLAPVTIERATLELVSTPAGAEVMLDGKLLDVKTPARLEVPPGRHAITLRLRGVERWRREVDARPSFVYHLGATLHEPRRAAPAEVASRPAPAVEAARVADEPRPEPARPATELAAMIEPPAPPPVIPAPPPAPPDQLTIAPAAMKALRVSGETQIQPPPQTLRMMISENRTRVAPTLKLCIGADGAVASVSMLASTKYPEYDRRLIESLRAWRFRPHLTGGVATPACSAITLHFQLH